jgi:FkbM family methyltransferase
LSPRELCKSLLNAAAGVFGARLVGAHWGPRGFREALVRARSRGFVPSMVFDIGASDGQWTRECRTVFAQSRYVLVDPLERNREPLMAMSRADSRVSVFSGIAAADHGFMHLHDHGDQSSVLASDDFPGTLIRVEARTVDSLFEDHGSPSPVLLKADVQGFELDVLRGAERCLQATEMLILEVSFRRVYRNSALAHEIIAWLGERGFRIYDICSYLQRASDRDLLQSDMVFVHESSALFSGHGWT